MAVHTIAVPHLLHAIGFSLYLDRQLRRPQYVLRTAVMSLHCENDRCPSPASCRAAQTGSLCVSYLTSLFH